MATEIPYFDLTSVVNSNDTELKACSQKKPSNRCGAPICNRKLMLTDITCVCGLRCCMTHRDASAHACTFDYRAQAIARLKESLVKSDSSTLKDRI